MHLFTAITTTIILVPLAAGSDQGVMPIAKATSPIRIDGRLDEPAWKDASPVEAKYLWGKTGQASTQPRMISRFTWDDDYLYIGYETFDKNLVALGNGSEEGPPGNRREGCSLGHPTKKPDLVEFFVSFGDQKFFWEVHQNANNQFTDIWCTVTDETQPIVKTTRGKHGIIFAMNEFIDDDTDAGLTLKRAITLKPKADGQPSTVNDDADEDLGYVGEIRLPWFGLGGPLAAQTLTEQTAADGTVKQVRGPWKMAGQELLLLSVVENGDDQPTYHHSSATFPGSWFHKGSAHWPRYRLVDKVK